MANYDPFAENNELFLRVAYGMNTLGMPRFGLSDNVQNIDKDLL